MRVQIPKARAPALPTASTFSTPSRPFQVDAQPAQGIVPSSESRLRIGELPPADHPAPGPIRRPALQSTRLPAARAVQARIPAFHGGVSAVIQRIGDEEGKALVEKARLGMVDGPGNLEESSQEARQRFLRAQKLLYWLNDYRDTSLAILDALCRVHGIANPGDKSVKEYINQDASDEKAGEIAKARKNLEDEARSLKGLADLVLFDFAREKTGGGSCDHCSAHMFFSLAHSHPDANISVEKYMPVSNDEYEITPPEGLPYHRVASMKDEEGEYVFDPWWPGGKFEKLNEENEKAYHQRETVMEWKPSNQEFVDAFRLELEHHYKAVKEEFLAEDLGDEVNAKWTIKNKQKE